MLHFFTVIWDWIQVMIWKEIWYTFKTLSDTGSVKKHNISHLKFKLHDHGIGFDPGKQKLNIKKRDLANIPENWIKLVSL